MVINTILSYRINNIVEEILLEILSELRRVQTLDDKPFAKIIHRHNKNISKNSQHFAKKQLLPFYLEVKQLDPERWASWQINPDLEQRLLKLLQVKPRRTASGVATITVITKPWQCSSDCIYCPNDLQMPKSYLSDEPACQRAQMNHFDPYLQVASRLQTLARMGHVTDKIELIVLGGTWSDYPQEYQIWFVAEMFRALNDIGSRSALCQKYETSRSEPQQDDSKTALQQGINNGDLTYNQAVKLLGIYQDVAAEQMSSLSELVEQQKINETAKHRVVGLVVETRPDTISADSLKLLRQLGCTKVQMGIQSLNPAVLGKNNRNISVQKIRQAFELLRVFGFKIHVHFMLNLYGSNCQADKLDYKKLVTEAAYLPDEVKLYPCVLVQGTKLCEHFASGCWQPYSEAELLDVLVADTLATPAFVRISRMIRDISAHDIVAGNRKANLRQLVEKQIANSGQQIQEIRHREISTDALDLERLKLETLAYETTVTSEYFLQWVTPSGGIAGFLRLSLPSRDFVQQHRQALPVGPGEAMIREVHIYGRAAALHKTGEGAQHLGLGRQLIEAACEIAKTQGYKKLNVISSVGTQEYYRGLGFDNNGLYQQKNL